MLIKILIGLAVVLVALAILVALQPSEFRVERSAVIAAPPSAIFPNVDQLRRFQEWNPFAKADPNMKASYSGPEAGVGASMAWNGNREAGEGRMTTVESRPGELIRFKLEFLRPFAATNMAQFTFQPQGENTIVTWSMVGQSNFILKAMHLVMDCDKMCGGEFEKGLANLKALSEGAGSDADEAAKKFSFVAP